LEAKAQRVRALLAVAEAEAAEAATAAAEAAAASPASELAPLAPSSPSASVSASARAALDVKVRRLRNQVAALAAKAVAVATSHSQAPSFWISVGLGEGKNRQVRRLCARAGLVVRRLVRVSFGPLGLTLGQLDAPAAPCGSDNSGGAGGSGSGAGGSGSGHPSRPALLPGEARRLEAWEVAACYEAAGLTAPPPGMAMPLPSDPVGADLTWDDLLLPEV
jgi:hypothetical protein